MLRYTWINPKDVIKLTCKGVEIHVTYKDGETIATCSDVTLKMLCKYLEWAKEGTIQFYGWVDDDE